MKHYIVYREENARDVYMETRSVRRFKVLARGPMEAIRKVENCFHEGRGPNFFFLWVEGCIPEEKVRRGGIKCQDMKKGY